MSGMPKGVNTRQLAILAELGEDPSHIPAQGWATAEGYIVVGVRPGTGNRSWGETSPGTPTSTLIPWPSDTIRDRALAAVHGDFLESIGYGQLDGATTEGEPNAYASNAGEFAARWNSTPPEARDDLVRRIVENAETATRCFVTAHRERIVQYEHEIHLHHAREAARQRDAEHPESAPESVMDAAFASQSEWWTPGDDARLPVVQLAPLDDGSWAKRLDVVIATLIEQVAEAAYRATLAHLSPGTPDAEKTGGQ